MQTLSITALEKDYGKVEVDLDVHPREITLDIQKSQEEALKRKIRGL